MLIELRGSVFIDSAHASYREGKRAIISVTIEADEIVEAAVDALKGGAKEVLCPTTACTIKDDEGNVLHSGSAGNLATTFGLVQEQYRKTGERAIYGNVFDIFGGIFTGPVRVVAFRTFGTVWEGDITPVDPPDTDEDGTGLMGRFWQNLSFVGEPLAQLVGPPYRDPGQAAYGPGSGDVNPPGPVVAEQDDFSARWTGRLKFPETGQYRWGVEADDGFKLYMDGKEVMSYWKDNHDDRKVSGWFTQEADSFVTIWVEFYAKPQGTVTLKTKWQTPSSPTVWVYPPIELMYPTDGTDAPPTAAERPRQELWYAEDVARYD